MHIHASNLQLALTTFLVQVGSTEMHVNINSVGNAVKSGNVELA